VIFLQNFKQSNLYALVMKATIVLDEKAEKEAKEGFRFFID